MNVVVLIAIALSVCCVLHGCGGGDAPSPAPSPTPSPNADAVVGFMKLDKQKHCQGCVAFDQTGRQQPCSLSKAEAAEVAPFMVYERNLEKTRHPLRTEQQDILQNGQKAGLTQVETVALYGWSDCDDRYINPIAWGADNATIAVRRSQAAPTIR